MTPRDPQNAQNTLVGTEFINSDGDHYYTAYIDSSSKFFTNSGWYDIVVTAKITGS